MPTKNLNEAVEKPLEYILGIASDGKIGKMLPPSDGADGAPGPQGDPGTPGTNGTNGTNGVGVPAGGTAGQVLQKVNSADYNTTWATPSGGVVGVHCPIAPKPGDIVDASVNATTAVTAASAVRRCDWVPFIPCYNMNVGSMSVEVTTSVAGSKISLGIYNDASMFPGSPDVESDRLDTDTTGVKTWALPTPYTLLKGNVYWLANITTHGVTFRALPVGALLPLALSGTVGARAVCWRVTSGGTLLPVNASGAALTSANTTQVRLHIV